MLHSKLSGRNKKAPIRVLNTYRGFWSGRQDLNLRPLGPSRVLYRTEPRPGVGKIRRSIIVGFCQRLRFAAAALPGGSAQLRHGLKPALQDSHYLLSNLMLKYPPPFSSQT